VEGLAHYENGQLGQAFPYLLGDFYAARRDTAQAEREYKAAGAVGPVSSMARIRLADFYFAWLRVSVHGERLDWSNANSGIGPS